VSLLPSTFYFFSFYTSSCLGPFGNGLCRWLKLLHYLCGSAKRPLIGSQVRCTLACLIL